MIFTTYGIAALVLAISAVLFQRDVLTPTTHTIFWCVAFFFASAGASSAYLTVSEIFPLEVRGQAISYFFSIAQIAGAIAPFIFGNLIGDGSSRGPPCRRLLHRCRHHAYRWSRRFVHGR